MMLWNLFYSSKIILPRFRPTLHHGLTSIASGKSLRDFILEKDASKKDSNANIASTMATQDPPYMTSSFTMTRASPLHFFVETYGCQMNFNDTEVVIAILEGTKRYKRTMNIDEANIILLMTCAIRENAEAKIWSRLDFLKSLEKKGKKTREKLTVGVLGCMAERLKIDLLEKKSIVDIICGPDAYRDLPRLLDQASDGIDGMNVMLSADETYADIAPIRLDPFKKSAFISIMRGCNNMCAFCIVPFTRGRERSRPIESILEQVQRLSDEGIKEITLLGQNVNSYSDESKLDSFPLAISNPSETSSPSAAAASSLPMSKGFKTIYKTNPKGRKFVDLLDKVSLIDPEMRIRFTSPHPKDFPDNLLALMAARPNICKQIHLPAQSGSNSVLERMRRGYTIEAYLELVQNIRSIIPEVAFSSDFIVGFCGESEEDHMRTLDLVEKAQYDMAYMYAYSLREKTMAHRRYTDDVPEEIKQKRLRQLIDKFYAELSLRLPSLIGKTELVLVEGESKKSSDYLSGRADAGRTIVFPKKELYNQYSMSNSIPTSGDYVLVKVDNIRGSTLIAQALSFSNIKDYYK